MVMLVRDSKDWLYCVFIVSYSIIYQRHVYLFLYFIINVTSFPISNVMCTLSQTNWNECVFRFYLSKSQHRFQRTSKQARPKTILSSLWFVKLYISHGPRSGMIKIYEVRMNNKMKWCQLQVVVKVEQFNAGLHSISLSQTLRKSNWIKKVL